ncbi:deoxyribonuclease IV [Streptacidiphilus jiangxiensis]|uniref:Probable endonuclease 4 n=1 Tax=Streptacidiphilus jiangxiensis TaxID=235985 RepID=A0A1H7Y473_STRJI|nr:deoxyribonuclease IV [Streptacidiphilus jiangxiensis]SEM40147.1 deoxyribonuclease-4 [Streptacidiphilus jiangxiensis]
MNDQQDPLLRAHGHDLRHRNPIGAHVPVAGRGLVGTGLAYAERIGAEAVQVFVANPRGWATPAGNPAHDRAFREECEKRDLLAYVHAPYLINFGSDTAATRERSTESLFHSLVRGRAIGARGVVVHTGSAIGAGRRAEAMAQLRSDLLPLLDQAEADDLPLLLLEPTAGQGESLCSRIEDLEPYVEALDRHPQLGVCLDTCHVFAAGHDLAAPGGAAEALDLLEKVFGPGRLKLVHANDSKDVVGARKDRHANIGDGHIGAAPFAELFRHPATAGVPLIVETPDRSAAPGFGHAEDVETLKRLRLQGQEAPTGAAPPRGRDKPST